MSSFGFQSCDCNGNYSFFCYSHEDRVFVGSIARKLNDMGINIWYDEGIKEGVDWRGAISSALANASCVLVFVSKSLMDSDYCYAELSMAQAKKKPRIPVLIENVNISSDISFLIGSVQYVNQTFSRDIDQIVEKLYPIILHSYEGKKSDVEISRKTMGENVDVFLRNGYYDKAFSESERIIHTNAQSYLGWWCLLKTLTRGNKLVKCSNSDNATGLILDDSHLEKVQKAYQMSIQMSDVTPEMLHEINEYYEAFQKNVNDTHDDISTVNNLFNDYWNTHNLHSDYITKNPIGLFPYYILTTICSLGLLLLELSFVWCFIIQDRNAPIYEKNGWSYNDQILISGNPEVYKRYCILCFVCVIAFIILLLVFYAFFSTTFDDTSSVLLISIIGIASVITFPCLIISSLCYKFYTEPLVKKYSKTIEERRQLYESTKIQKLMLINRRIFR